MAEKKDFYELEQEAAEDGTHIPEYPFKAGYIKRDYYSYYVDEDHIPEDGTSEKLDEAIKQYGSVHISVYYHSRLKIWMDKWYNRYWKLSDIKELLRRSGITKQEELNELSFDDIESVIRLRVIEKKNDAVKNTKNETVDDIGLRVLTGEVQVIDGDTKDESADGTVAITEKSETPINTPKIFKRLSWDAIEFFGPDEPYVPKYPFRAGYLLRNQSYFYVREDPDSPYEDEKGNKEEYIWDCERGDKELSIHKELYGSESPEWLFRSKLKKWMDKWFGGDWDVSDLKALLREYGITKQDELNELSFRDIEGILRVNLMKKKLMAAQKKQDATKSADTPIPQDKQDVSALVAKYSDLKTREPLESHPFLGVIEILIQERADEEKTLLEATKGNEIINIKEVKDGEDVLPPTISDALVKQAERLDDFLVYMKRVKAVLKKKSESDEEMERLVDDLIDWKNEFKVILKDDCKSDENEPAQIVIQGPFSYYIKQKYKTLSEIHHPNYRNRYSVDIDKIDPSAIAIKDKADIKTLELLQRQFEKGAEQYPSIVHRVMTWPFMLRMPKPPRETINDQIVKIRSHLSCQYNRLGGFFDTSNTLSFGWFDGPAKSLEGINRFHHLAKEAEKVIYKLLSTRCDPVLLFPNWIHLIHIVRNSHIINDGWDGLFDDDVDFSEEGYREGLYTFRQSEDIFLDSVFVCNVLLNSTEKNKPKVNWGTDKGKKEIGTFVWEYEKEKRCSHAEAIRQAMNTYDIEGLDSKNPEQAIRTGIGRFKQK